MNCANRDQDLLLIAHGQLSLFKSFLVRLHLRGCSACRKRLAEMSYTSALMSSVVRDEPAIALPQHVMKRTTELVKRRALWSLLSILLFLVLGASVVVSAVRSAKSAQTSVVDPNCQTSATPLKPR